MIRKIIIKILFPVLLLVGCKNSSQQEMNASDAMDNDPIIVLSPTSSMFQTTVTPTISPSPTTPIASVAPLVTNSPTATPVIPQNNCWDIMAEIPADHLFSGQVVLQASTSQEVSYLRDMVTGERLSITNNVDTLDPAFAGDFTVSPNGMWLAYLGFYKPDQTTETVISVIRSASGEEIIDLRNDVEFAQPYYWLNDEQIVFRRYYQDKLDRPVFLNPFTGEKQELLPEYPSILADDYIYWGWPSITIYDPTLTRVVYVGEGDNYTNKLVLWDTLTSQAIVEIPNLGFFYHPPQWSPDGENFVYAATSPDPRPERREDELVLVSRDGEIAQVTNLSDRFEESKIFTYAWAPNGQYIAFWVNRSLAIIDVETGEIIDFCIQTSVNDPRSPIWSPDSKYLAIETIDENGLSQTVLVDIESEYAAYLAKNVFPVGWMIQSP